MSTMCHVTARLLNANLCNRRLFKLRIASLSCLLGYTLSLWLMASAYAEEATKTTALKELISDNVYKIEVIAFKHLRSDSSEAPLNQQTYQYPKQLIRLLEQDTAEIISPISSDEDQPSGLSIDQLNKRLNSDQYQLKSLANKLTINGSYQVLFHEAWFQQAGSHTDGDWHLIEGGQWYNPFYELSGSIRLSKNRHLKIATDLWLTQFSDNQSTQTPWHSESQTAIMLANHEQALLLADQHKKPNSLAKRAQTKLTDENNLSIYEYNQTPQLSGKRYQAKQVYALKQKHNLRHGELHYIDHPKLGIFLVVHSLKKLLKDKETL